MMKAVLLLLMFGPVFIQCASLESAESTDESDAGLDRSKRYRMSKSVMSEDIPDAITTIKCYKSTVPIGRNPRDGDFSKRIISYYEAYTGKQSCGMNSKFVLGTFKAADCGTAAIRFCCDGEYCNDPKGALVDKAWVDYQAEKIAEAIKKGK